MICVLLLVPLNAWSSSIVREPMCFAILQCTMCFLPLQVFFHVFFHRASASPRTPNFSGAHSNLSASMNEGSCWRKVVKCQINLVSLLICLQYRRSLIPRQFLRNCIYIIPQVYHPLITSLFLQRCSTFNGS